MKYTVKYKKWSSSEEAEVVVEAASKGDAYDLATYDVIPKLIGEVPYSSWVDSVTYKTGRIHYFKTCEGYGY